MRVSNARQIPLGLIVNTMAGAVKRRHMDRPFWRAHVPDEFLRLTRSLEELDAATLASLRGEINRINLPDGPDIAHFKGALAAAGAKKQHNLRRDAADELRASMAWWGGHHNKMGHTDAEAQKLFYFRFGMDVMTAQTLPRAKSVELKEKVDEHLHEIVSNWEV